MPIPILILSVLRAVLDLVRGLRPTEQERDTKRAARALYLARRAALLTHCGRRMARGRAPGSLVCMWCGYLLTRSEFDHALRP